MATNLDDDRLRQYLLGGLQGEECVALEEEYVVDESALDRVQAAEYDLIDAYLAGQLAPGDRERFDRHYLASPVHRHRVATARQLRLAADRHDAAPKANAARTSREIRFGLTWVLAAAALVLAIAGGAWLMRARLAPTVGPAGAQNPAGAPAPAPAGTSAADAPKPPPTLLAISLSPAGVRGAEGSPPVTIPPGTDRVDVNLELSGSSRPFSKARAVIQTVTGREVWRGPAIAEVPTRAPAHACIEVPADRLAPDDYIVTMVETYDNGPEVEGLRYFLRVRAR